MRAEVEVLTISPLAPILLEWHALGAGEAIVEDIILDDHEVMLP
jgi:hypothetical protein